MKTKALFHLNIINNDKANVYIILPKINIVDFGILTASLEFLNKYERVILMCSLFEYSFYQLLINKSPTFAEYKSKIDIDIINSSKFTEIQSKECIIIALRENFLIPENNKKALLCSPYENSDILFNDFKDTLTITNRTFLKHILEFMQIKEINTLRGIDLSPELVLKNSSLVSGLKDKKYHVIVLNSFISTIKLTNYLKKHRLKKQLIIISQSKINVTDPKLFYFKDYNFLDFIAFELQAESIYCSASEQYKNVIRNLKINLSLTTLYKDFKLILDDITEP